MILWDLPASQGGYKGIAALKNIEKNPKREPNKNYKKEEKMSVAVYLIQYFEIVPNISLVILSHFFLSDTL